MAMLGGNVFGWHVYKLLVFLFSPSSEVFPVSYLFLQVIMFPVRLVATKECELCKGKELLLFSSQLSATKLGG